MTHLSERTRASLPASVAQPAYDRAALRSGIVHLGLGAFHRAHQALYTEAAMANDDLRWGIVGVSLRSRSVASALIPQDLLYCVLEREGGDVQAHLVGVLRAALHAPTQLSEVLDALADPQTHLVTSTVSEKGYSVQSATGELDVDDEWIRHDLAHPEAPMSTIGLLFAGLRRRPRGAPLTVLCCDNMAHNGATLRKLVLQFASLVDSDVARHIESTIAFPSSMVDRIVPAATAGSLDWAAQQLGLRDAAAIVCETFSQWVIEDRFAGARPAWERGGALLVDDVRPYQAMKLRLLNGTHSAIAYIGQLRGLPTVSEAMADPLVGSFARRLMKGDLLATVAAPPRYDVRRYCDALLQRFENPNLAHRTEQIAMDGTQKVPVRWLPPLRESLRDGVERKELERTLACWLHYLVAGVNETGEALKIDDAGAAELVARLRAGASESENILSALAHRSVFGEAEWPQPFVDRMAKHLKTLRDGGVAALIS